jgi:hypothetical protein
MHISNRNKIHLVRCYVNLVVITYTGKETRLITQLFRNTNLKTSYRTIKTNESLLKENPIYMDKYSASGIYKLKFPDCGKAYVGQTGRASP